MVKVDDSDHTAIVSAMRAVNRHDTPATRAWMLGLLLGTTLLVATPERPGSRHPHTLHGGEKLTLLTGTGPHGVTLPVFTDIAAMELWRPDGGGYVVLAARAVFELAAGNDIARIVIDPGSGVHGEVSRAEIEALAQGQTV